MKLFYDKKWNRFPTSLCVIAFNVWKTCLSKQYIYVHKIKFQNFGPYSAINQAKHFLNDPRHPPRNCAKGIILWPFLTFAPSSNRWGIIGIFSLFRQQRNGRQKRKFTGWIFRGAKKFSSTNSLQWKLDWTFSWTPLDLILLHTNNIKLNRFSCCLYHFIFFRLVVLQFLSCNIYQNKMCSMKMSKL